MNLLLVQSEFSYAALLLSWHDKVELCVFSSDAKFDDDKDTGDDNRVDDEDGCKQ